VQVLPNQEKGTRPSRALPYTLYINGTVAIITKTIKLTFSNEGLAGAHFNVYDLLIPTNLPKKYTVSSKKSISDLFTFSSGKYNLSVYGPNGFVRQFADDITSINTLSVSPQVSMLYKPLKQAITTLVFNNTGSQTCKFIIKDNAYGSGPWVITVPPFSVISKDWSVSSNGNWYDFTVTIDIFKFYMRRFMGRVENGFDSISDPAMSGDM